MHDAATSPLEAKNRSAHGGALLALLAAAAVAFVPTAMKPSASAVDARLWATPAFSFVDHLGRPTSAETLRGAPYIASFLFTRCPTVCPMLTSKLARVQGQTTGRRIAFVAFSVDPEHDTAQVLTEFAHTWRLDEARWHLLPTTEPLLRDALAGFRVTARTTSDPGSPIIHTTAVFLVDADGFVRGVYPSDDDREVERLTRDAIALADRSTP